MAGPRLRAFRTRAISRAFGLVSAIGRRIPLATGRRLGRALGRLAWHVARRERRKALANFAQAFPERTEHEQQQAIRAMFRHLGESLFEMVWLPNLDVAMMARTTIVEGIEPVRALIDAGHGVMAFTGHCGNWEWLARVVSLSGCPVTTMQRERDDEDMGDFITSIRTDAGIRTIDRGSPTSGREMLQAIRRGGILAFLIDQNIRAESVKVPFFGRPALTPIGPAKLAVRTSTAVVTMFIERRADGMQHVRVNPPVEVSRKDDAVALTARITADTEAQIRRVPEQWVWMHDRWRERPKWDVSVGG